MNPCLRKMSCPVNVCGRSSRKFSTKSEIESEHEAMVSNLLDETYFLTESLCDSKNPRQYEQSLVKKLEKVGSYGTRFTVEDRKILGDIRSRLQKSNSKKIIRYVQKLESTV